MYKLIMIMSLIFFLTGCGGGSGTNDTEQNLSTTGKNTNHPPIAISKRVEVFVDDGKSSITLEGSDADGDTILYEIVSMPDYGFTTGKAPNIMYEPSNDEYYQTDYLEYRVFDGKEYSDTALITIDIKYKSRIPKKVELYKTYSFDTYINEIKVSNKGKIYFCNDDKLYILDNNTWDVENILNLDYISASSLKYPNRKTNSSIDISNNYIYISTSSSIYFSKVDSTKLKKIDSIEHYSYDKFYFKNIVTSMQGAYAIGNFKSVIDSGEDSFDGYLLKYDNDGNKLWEKIISGSGDDFLNRIIVDNDDNIYIVGRTNSIDGYFTYKNNKNIDAFIVKLDKNGNLIWNKKFGGNDYDEFNSITIDKNDNTYVMGETYSKDGSLSPFLVKYDKFGNVQWKKVFTGWKQNYHQFSIQGYYGMVVNNNELYIGSFLGPSHTTGIKTKGGADALLLKINGHNGNILWIKNFGGKKNDSFRDLKIDNNNNIIAIGNLGMKALLVKFK